MVKWELVESLVWSVVTGNAYMNHGSFQGDCWTLDQRTSTMGANESRIMAQQAHDMSEPINTLMLLPDVSLYLAYLGGDSNVSDSLKNLLAMQLTHCHLQQEFTCETS